MNRFSALTGRGPFAAALLALAAAANPALAQEPFPSRQLSLLVGTAAGSFSDVLGRIVAAQMAEKIGSPVVVEARPGAGGAVAITLAAKARPDGYTSVIALSSAITQAPFLIPDLGYDPVKDLSPVGLFGRIYTVIVVNPNSRFKTFAELIAEARAKPETISFGFIGAGNQVTLARLANGTGGARFLQTRYASGTVAVQAMLGGHIDVTLDAMGGARELVAAGKLRPLAVTSTAQHPLFPGVPALSEFVPGLDQISWYGLFVPAGTPRDRILFLNREMNAALGVPKVREAIAKMNLEISESTPEELGALLKREMDLNGPIIKANNIKG
jgi:tripartite-type tricarboxylate transporter receptor subunit TctC